MPIRRALLLGGVALCVLMPGCTPRRMLTPKIELESFVADRLPPQTARTAVRWEAAVHGGVGELRYEFRTRRAGEELVEQSGPSAVWVWEPRAAGRYEVGVIVRDSLGYLVRSGWSRFDIAAPLAIDGFAPSLDSPRRAGASDLFWTVQASGGVGQRTYEFWLEDGGERRPVQVGPTEFWRWSPRVLGEYRARVTVRDSIGNSVDGEWSAPFRITPSVSRTLPLALFPIENLSDRPIPSTEIQDALRRAIGAAGLTLVDADALDEFMVRHRVRHVGGIAGNLGKALEDELGAVAVLMVAVEQRIDDSTPRFALHARLVSTGEKATILWMEGTAAAGHDSLGWLELGRVGEIELLRDRVLGTLVGSLQRQVEREERPRRAGSRDPRRSTGRRFEPVGFYRSPDSVVDTAAPLRVAVLPFFNESPRTDAGRVMMLHVLRELGADSSVELVEPGEVRQVLLQSRLIFHDGPSLPQSELLRSLLDVDLVISGTVTDYQDPRSEWGEPFVAFSVHGIEPERKRVGWTSISNAHGDDGVFFFRSGRVYTAHELASRMVREVIVRMMKPGGDRSLRGAATHEISHRRAQARLERHGRDGSPRASTMDGLR